MNQSIDNTTDTDRAAALTWLWDRVIAHVSAMRLDRTGPLYEVCSDDVMMREAAQDDAFAWLDDCEARLGCDEADARAAMVDFIFARDGTEGSGVLIEDVLATATYEAAGRLHANHPALRGLFAMLPASASRPDDAPSQLG